MYKNALEIVLKIRASPGSFLIGVSYSSLTNYLWGYDRAIQNETGKSIFDSPFSQWMNKRIGKEINTVMIVYIRVYLCNNDEEKATAMLFDLLIEYLEEMVSNDGTEKELLS